MIPTVSLCMIVRNEAANLPRCLASVRDEVDELIVVDTGSSDDTPVLAAALGARVFHHPWQDSFAEARNVALDQATGQWILHLDADEELAPASRRQVRQAAAATDATDAAGLRVNVRSRNGEGDLTEFYDCWQVRLFRNRPEFRYEGAVHEQIMHAITRAGQGVVPSHLEIIHYGYLQDRVQGDGLRVQRNLRLLERAFASQPESAYLCAQLGLDYFRAGQMDEALACLGRSLRELDGRSLPRDMLQAVFVTLAQIGLARQDFALALTCSQANLDTGGVDFVTLMALKVAGCAHMGVGRCEIGAAREDLLEVKGGQGSASGRLESRLRMIHQEMDLARSCFTRMLDNPALTTQARSQVEAILRGLDVRLATEVAPRALACVAQVEARQDPWTAYIPAQELVIP